MAVDTMTQFVDMIDAIGVDASRIPAGPKRVAIYLTGSGGIAWTSADVARLLKDDPDVQLIMRIDQSNTILHVPSYLVKDIEPGASTLGIAVVEATQRKNVGLRTGFYFSRSDMNAVVAAVDAAGLVNEVDFWVADWNFTRTEAIAFIEQNPRVKAVQYASPTSNPNDLVPGSSRTLAEVNADLSVTRADWPAPVPVPAPKPVPKPEKSQALLTVTRDTSGVRWAVEGVDNPGDVAIQNTTDWHVDVGYLRGAWTQKPMAATKPVAKRAALQIHPKVAAVGATAAALTGVRAALAAFGVHVPLTDTEQAAVLAALPAVAGWLKSSGVQV